MTSTHATTRLYVNGRPVTEMTPEQAIARLQARLQAPEIAQGLAGTRAVDSDLAEEQANDESAWRRETSPSAAVQEPTTPTGTHSPVQVRALDALDSYMECCPADDVKPAAAALVKAQSVYNAAMDDLIAHGSSYNGPNYAAALRAIKVPYAAAVQAALDEEGVDVKPTAAPVVKPVVSTPTETYQSACKAAKAEVDAARSEYQDLKYRMTSALRRLESAKNALKATERKAYLTLKASGK